MHGQSRRAHSERHVDLAAIAAPTPRGCKGKSWRREGRAGKVSGGRGRGCGDYHAPQCSLERRVYSPFSWFVDINRFAVPFVADPSAKTYENFVGRDGKKKWMGGKDLKTSQAYPELFGENAQHLCSIRRHSINQWVSLAMDRADRTALSQGDWSGSDGDDWDDAGLASVFRFLLTL